MHHVGAKTRRVWEAGRMSCQRGTILAQETVLLHREASIWVLSEPMSTEIDGTTAGEWVDAIDGWVPIQSSAYGLAGSTVKPGEHCANWAHLESSPILPQS